MTDHDLPGTAGAAAPGPDRRMALAGLALAGMAAALPPVEAARAQAAGRIRLRALALPARLSGNERPASRLFRLAPVPDDGAPVPEPVTVIRVKEGDAASLEIENALPQPVAFHVRGLRGPNAIDGVPGLTGPPIAPGATASIPLPTRQTGTFILQPSLPGHVAEQVARGLFAVLIVEERAPPAFDHDIVLAVSDWRLDEAGTLADDFNARRDAARFGRLGNVLVANGGPAPGAMNVRPGARLRVRMVNVSNARVIPLRISGFSALVYSVDSTPCQPFDPLKRTVIMSPGTRLEMVLEAPPAPGAGGAVEARIGAGIPIFRFTAEGAPLPARGAVTALPDPGLPPAIRLQDATRADVILSGGIGAAPAEAEAAAVEAKFPDPRAIFRVNDSPAGFSGNPVARLRRGRVLVLALMNRTAWPQVIAVHGHAFRLLHAFDDGWEPYFLDTLYLAANSVARIALIADNPGRWAIRATIAEHYAAGVATWFEVT